MVRIFTRETDCDVTVIRIVQMEGHRLIRFVRRQIFSCIRFIKRQLPDHMQFNLVAKTDFYDVTDLEPAFLRLSSPVYLHVVMYV